MIGSLRIALFAAIVPLFSFSEQFEHGRGVTGWDGAFNVSFVSAGQHSVTGLARIVVSSSSGYPQGYTNPVDFISAAYFKYRWRQHHVVETDQYGREDWKTIFMVKTGSDTLATNGEIEIPDFECDIEFYFEATSHVPYYQYVDYSGLNLGVSNYTEEPPLLIRSHLMTGTSDDVLASGGKDWFVRVRAGRSKVRAVRRE